MNKKFFEWIKVNIGSCLSWAITFGWLIFIYFKIHNGVLPKDLNEFGDFIAGAFAPLAFFWLVRGFYQQGKGLKQNSDALNMQATELEKTTQALELQVQEMRASVEQQSRLAKVYEDELQQKHFQVQPYFEYSFKIGKNSVIDEPIFDEDDNVIDTYEERRIEFTLIIKNFGDTARNLIIRSRKGQPYIQRKQYKLDNSEKFIIFFDVDGEFAQELTEGKYCLVRLFKVEYQDIYGKSYEEYIKCIVNPITFNDDNKIYLHEEFHLITREEALHK